ncbi:MAG: LamG domain-containing protein [Candidatus Bathyarchaeota archaeon]|nr:LamG domain-containing protein [Candidatus Bathyarchaeota archaeon]
MGDNPGPDRKPFDGIIDEVSIFNRALSIEELDNLDDTEKAICYMGDATNQYGVILDAFHVKSPVYTTGSGFVPNSLVNLYITTDQAWTDGMAITAPIRTITVQAGASGNLGPVMVWASADFGHYDLIFDTDQNGQYDIGTNLIGFDVVDHPNHPGFSVSSLLTSSAVGGFYAPVNSLIVLAPYMIAALFIGIIASIITVRRKKRD